MAIAKAVGFNVPPFVLFNHEELGNIFAIKRFDITKENQHLRLEDAGQVLGSLSEEKYESTYESLANAIVSFSDASKPDLVEMWKRLIFCYLTANGDMHLKNWSFLEQESFISFAKILKIESFINKIIKQVPEWCLMAEKLCRRSFLTQIEQRKYIEIIKSRNEELKKLI